MLLFANDSAEVYMQDLESALSYMLNIEVATKQIIQGAEFSALRNFVGMLAKVTTTVAETNVLTSQVLLKAKFNATKFLG